MQNSDKKDVPTVPFDPLTGSSDNSQDDLSLASGIEFVKAADEGIWDLEYASFAVREHLATGGMGIIVSADDEQFQRGVALKILSSRLSGEARNEDRFVREAALTAGLQHPGIVPVYSAGKASDGRPFFSMRRIEGETLEDAIRKRSRAGENLPQFLRGFLKICHTISYCHDHGVVHCDLKPSNIMLGKYGEVIVMDFGLAIRTTAKMNVDEVRPFSVQDLEMHHENTPTGSAPTDYLHGTPQYMSPEQARGRRTELNEKTDIFGLGAILFQILVGDQLYDGESLIQIIKRAAVADLSIPRQKLEQVGCDPRLIELCMECLNPDQKSRPPNAQVVLERVTAYLDSFMTVAEEDIENFFKLSPDLFCIADYTGMFLRVNQNFGRVLGYSEEEILSIPFLRRVHPEDHEKTRHAMQRLEEGKPVSRFVNRYQTSSGEYRWFEWTAKPMVEEELIFAVARDITASMEDRLFSQILDVTPRSLVVIDQVGRIVLVNEFAETLFGYTREELQGKPVEVLVPDYIRSTHAELRNSYLQMPKSSQGPKMRTVITSSRGQERPVEIELSSLETDVGQFAVAWIRQIEPEQWSD